jgi:hypothetical protein
MPNQASPWVKKPNFRLLQVFAFDPSLELSIETAAINKLSLSLPWEDLDPGPVGEYLEVVDVDPPSGCFYPPVDLNDRYLLVQDGLPPSESTPQFHQQMAYAVSRKTIQNFAHALGRPVLWSPRRVNGKAEYVRHLRLYPHAMLEANAFYSPNRKAILFGYFPAAGRDVGTNLPGGMVFTCLSHDIIAHETTHALLDGLHPYFGEPSNMDVLALHEAFADIVALFQHFSFPEVLHSQIARTRGDLTGENLMGELAQQLGQAIGRRGALRSALGAVDQTTGLWQRARADPALLEKTLEPHARGSILVAAVFDAFLTVYNSATADLLRIATGGSGILPGGAIHPDLVKRLADEAAKTSQRILTMCIRALDYCPPVDITFGEYLRAIITADHDVNPVDRDGYRIAIIEAFRRYGIYPTWVRSLSEESLLWLPPDSPLLRDKFFSARQRMRLINLFGEQQKKSSNDRHRIFDLDTAYQQTLLRWLKHDLSQQLAGDFKQAIDALFIRLGPEEQLQSIERGPDGLPDLEVNSVRPAYRLGTEGHTVADLVVEVNQRRRGYLDRDLQSEVDSGRTPPPPADFTFRGGATLLISMETGVVRYVIGKHAGSNRRLEMQRRYLAEDAPDRSLRVTYFGDARANYFQGGADENEPFALLHRYDPGLEEPR